jgi:transcriptional regulator with XRE-family HTH domain
VNITLIVILLVEFGKRVRSLRRAQGLTEEQLAEAADLNPRTVQKIEAGQINILVTTLVRIQSALNCTAGEFFGEK